MRFAARPPGHVFQGRGRLPTPTPPLPLPLTPTADYQIIVSLMNGSYNGLLLCNVRFVVRFRASYDTVSCDVMLFQQILTAVRGNLQFITDDDTPDF